MDDRPDILNAAMGDMTDNCLRAAPLIAGMLGALDAVDQQFLDAHLAGCARCQSATAIAFTDDSLDAPVHAPSTSTNAKRLWSTAMPQPLTPISPRFGRGLVLAAAAITFLAVVFWLVRRDDPSATRHDVVPSSAVVRIPAPPTPPPTLPSPPPVVPEQPAPVVALPPAVAHEKAVVQCSAGTSLHRLENRSAVASWCEEPDGSKQGPYALWIVDGAKPRKLQERQYRHGRPQGVWTLWQDNGGVKMVAELDDGKPVTINNAKVKTRLADSAAKRLIQIFTAEERARLDSSDGDGAVALPDGLTQRIISDGIASVTDRVRACGDQAPATGKVKVSVSVSSDGRVTSVSVDSTPDPTIGSCVAAEIQKATFDKTQHGGSFSYPFVF